MVNAFQLEANAAQQEYTVGNLVILNSSNEQWQAWFDLSESGSLQDFKIVATNNLVEVLRNDALTFSVTI